MRSAPNFEHFESEWRAYLNCIEKVWVKSERACYHLRTKFQPWQGTYHRLRKKDMLLRYLKQARDADNHSVQDLAQIKPGGRGIRFVNPKGGYIKHMEINNGEIVRYEGDPIVVEEIPSTIAAVSVKNSGEWYNPPTSHLGKPVVSQHPLELAVLGHAFYEGYLNEIEKTFFLAEP
jgi:hypothetical protein